MANIEAGNDTQLMIKSLVESYGLIISSTRSPGSVCAISTLEGIHDKYGFHVLLHLNHKVEIIIDLALNTERSSDHRQRPIEATESIVQKEYGKYAKWEAELLNAMNKLGE